MTTAKYQHVILEEELLDSAKEYLKGRNYSNTKKLGKELGINRMRAAAVFYRLGWIFWSRNHPNGTTFARDVGE